MRILHVVPSYLPALRYGGTIYAVHGLVRALIQLGVAAEVYTTNVDGPGVSPVPVNRQTLVDGVPVTYFSSPLATRLYYSAAMAQALRANIHRFDVVHLHSVYLWPTLAAARASRGAGVPYVLSPHGMLVPSLVLAKGTLRKRTWIRLFERANLAGAAAIHVTAEIEKSDLAQLGLALAPVSVIPLGVDEPQSCAASAVSPDVAQLLRDPAELLYFGRIHWKKGIANLISALPLLPGVRATIAGNDEEGECARLQALARQEGVADRVRFLPRQISGADKEALFGAARLFVLPSLSENFGIVVLEALLRRLPVIASEAVGAASMVADSGAGAVVDGSPATLATAIRGLLADEDAGRAAGERGREHVLKHYSWPGVARQMADLYQVIGGGAVPGEFAAC